MLTLVPTREINYSTPFSFLFVQKWLFSHRNRQRSLFSKEPACAKGRHPSQGDSPHPSLPSRHQRNSKRRTMGRRTAYNPAFEPHVRASYRSVPAIQSKNHAGINPTHILGANRESAIREFFVIQFTARTSLFPRRV